MDTYRKSLPPHNTFVLRLSCSLYDIRFLHFYNFTFIVRCFYCFHSCSGDTLLAVVVCFPLWNDVRLLLYLTGFDVYVCVCFRPDPMVPPFAAGGADLDPFGWVCLFLSCLNPLNLFMEFNLRHAFKHSPGFSLIRDLRMNSRPSQQRTALDYWRVSSWKRSFKLRCQRVAENMTNKSSRRLRI